MKKIFVAILVIIIILAMGVSVSACQEADRIAAPVYSKSPIQFTSREQVAEMVEEYQNYYNTITWNIDLYDIFDIISGLGGCGCGANETSAEPSSDTAEYSVKGNVKSNSLYATEESLSSDSQTYTKTNVQVDGMDEGDIVKTDGKYIYYLNNGGLTVLSAGVNGELKNVYSVKYENFSPIEMYVLGNHIAVIGNQYEEEVAGNYMYGLYGYYQYADATSVRVYDVTIPTNPTLEREVTIDGYLNTSRLNNGYLYLIGEYNFAYANEDEYIPCIIDSANGGEKKEMEVGNMYYFEGVACYSYLVLGKINLNDASEFAYKAYMGAGDTVYVSENSIYVGVTDYMASYSITSDGYYDFDADMNPEQTRIAKFNLSDLEFKATGNVDGTLNDRYSLDEYEGNLRVASCVTNTDTSYSNVTVLNENMEQIGFATNIAPEERIYSARFSGTVGNIVTYKQLDPLFKIDLTDPTNPIVSDGLKKDGVSYYLQYVSGTDLLIGLGYGTETEEAYTTDGRIEVALFDNSGTESELINRIYIGDDNTTAYTSAIYDAHEILYDKDLDLFAFVISTSTYDKQTNKTTCFNGLYVFGFMEGELKLKAVLSNCSDKDYIEDQTDNLTYEWKCIERGLRIGNYIYTVSNAKVVSYSLDTYEKAGEAEVSVASYDEDGYIVISYPTFEE